MIGHRRTCHSILVLALCGVLACLGSVAAPAQEDPPEAEPAQVTPKTFLASSEVVLKGKAQARGALALVFEPEGGEANLVRVNVFEKTAAKKIAMDLVKELTFTAGDGYKVKLAGDRKIVIKAKSKKIARFSLRIDEVSVNGVSVRITK